MSKHLTKKELELIFEVFNPNRWPISRDQAEIDLSLSAYDKLFDMYYDLKQEQREKTAQPR